MEKLKNVLKVVSGWGLVEKMVRRPKLPKIQESTSTPRGYSLGVLVDKVCEDLTPEYTMGVKAHTIASLSISKALWEKEIPVDVVIKIIPFLEEVLQVYENLMEEEFPEVEIPFYLNDREKIAYNRRYVLNFDETISWIFNNNIKELKKSLQ